MANIGPISVIGRRGSFLGPMVLTEKSVAQSLAYGSLLGPLLGMEIPFEDFSDAALWTAGGTNIARLTEANYRITAAAMRRDDECQYSADFGAGGPDAGFEIEFRFLIDSACDNSSQNGGIVAVTSVVDGRKAIRDAVTESGLFICVGANSSGQTYLGVLFESDGALKNSALAQNVLAFDTAYYGRFVYDPAVTANGTVYFDCWTNPNHTTTVFAQKSFALSVAPDSFQYVLVQESFENGSVDAPESDGWVDEVEIISPARPSAGSAETKPTLHAIEFGLVAEPWAGLHPIEEGIGT